MSSCGLANLGTCLPEKFFEYIVNILNTPIAPFLEVVIKLLSEPIRIDLFLSVWAIIIYMLSMFYALLLVGTGFSFMLSGHDPAKRENAKQWLRNIVIMIVLVQASYFIYELAINLSSIMTSATLTLVNPNFFLIGTSGLSNLGTEIALSFTYITTLIITTIILAIRYAVVAIGVVLFPIGIFFYFFNPLKHYGSLLLNFLGTNIFIGFFIGVLLTGFSRIAELDIFGDMKILVLISVFLFIDILMAFLMFFSIAKAGMAAYNKVGGLIAAFA